MTTRTFCCTPHTTPLGPVLLRASAAGLSGLWFEGQRHHPPLDVTATWSVAEDHPVLVAAANQLDAYFAGRRSRFDLPLDLSNGTAFQQAVWQCLLALPFGQQVAYGELGARIGRPRAVRAIGSAVGRNPISIVVPCHRVLASDGGLAGYAGGIERKRALLDLERN